MQYESFHEAENAAAQAGIALTASDRAKIAELQRAEMQRLQSLEPEAGNTWAERFNRQYPKLLNALQGVGEVLLTLTMKVIVEFGVPLALLILLVVEHQRVLHGIQLFEADYHLASFAAFALVFLNLVLEFVVHHVEHKAGYEQARDTRWSLRIFARNMAYRVGFGGGWQEQTLSPAERARRLLRIVTFTILALALAGSMRAVVDETEGVWHEALTSILTESSLSLIMTWAGGLLYALAAVMGAQLLSRYVAIRCTEIMATMRSADASPQQQYAAELDHVAAEYIAAKINQKRIRQQQRESANPTPPIGQYQPMGVNGHYSETE